MVRRYFKSILLMGFPGPKLFLSVVLNISLEENWATFVYLASDKLWRDSSEQGGGRVGGKYQYIFAHFETPDFETPENNLNRKQMVQDLIVTSHALNFPSLRGFSFQQVNQVQPGSSLKKSNRFES